MILFKKTFYFLIAAGFLCSCQSCFKEYEDIGSLIPKKYDFVAGVIAPDSSLQFTRNYATEVFVGRMIPAGRKNIYFIKGVNNPVMYNLLIGTRQWYRVYYDFDSTATVFIKSNNDSVQLTYSGYGIYKDIYRSLKIKSGENYQLIVKKENGQVYTSDTKAPTGIQILEPNQDTIRLVPKLISGNLWARNIDVKILYDEKPTYFIQYRNNSNFGSLYVYTMSSNNMIVGAIFQASGDDTTKITFIDTYLEIQGMDQNFATFNDPINNAGSDDFWPYLDSLERLNIHQRSNIEGSDDVVGVFGSYNAAVKRFTAMALWDSVKVK